MFQFDAQDAPPRVSPTTGATRPSRSSRRTRRYSSRQRSARAGRRVPRHGQGAPPRGHRGDPRRRLQPHRRGRSHAGPTLCFRGLDERRLLPARGATAAATRTTPARGNTLNANHSVVRRLIRDSLRYWVEQMHVDGFRFDLASILVARRVGAAAAKPAGALGHRVGSGARGHEADRRGVGRRRALPGRQLRRRRLAGVERPLPRRRAPLL